MTSGLTPQYGSRPISGTTRPVGLLGWPVATLFVTGDLFVFDNTQQLLKIITNVRVDNNTSLRLAYRDACARLAGHVAMLRRRQHAHLGPGLGLQREDDRHRQSNQCQRPSTHGHDDH